ncbi:MULTISPECIES: hypothetical protein [Pantoea]|nr:hypothetical protein [uncultured Pantoea sp.]
MTHNVYPLAMTHPDGAAFARQMCKKVMTERAAVVQNGQKMHGLRGQKGE